MRVMVIQGKMKDPNLLKKITEYGSKFLDQDMGKMLADMFSDYFRDFHGGTLLAREDGGFMYITYWTSQEAIENVMNSPLARQKMGSLDKFLEGSYTIEYYDSHVAIPTFAHT